MSLPLSKTLDPADFAELAEELVVVDRHFLKGSEQHPMRRWEYALALRALATWHGGDRQRCASLYDVGGAGSPFEHMLHDSAGAGIWPCVIDPAYNQWGKTLAQHVQGLPTLGRAVFCLSVLEHVEDLDQFLYHLSCLVAPGGLLFLTMDCIRGERQTTWPIDSAHFHWDRKRIFNDWARGVVHSTFTSREFQLFGEADLRYHGDQLYGSYSFASLALQKRS